MKKIIDKYNQLAYEDRHYFLLQLEFEETDEKWNLFLYILSNPVSDDSNYDILAIEVLKILAIADIPQEYLEKNCSVIIDIISNGKDDDIRNYAIMCVANFINMDKNVKVALINFLNTSCPDINLRFNAFYSLKSLNSVDEKKEIFIPFLEDEDLKEYVLNYFKELDKT